VRLVRADLSVLDAALAGDDALARVLGHAVAPGWATFPGRLRQLRAELAASGDGADWGTRLFVTEEPPELVGWGGFKGPPRDGAVEVGYEIAACRQGRGLATGALRAMLAEALADQRVTAVIAHTLPERNASNHILETAGFRFEWPATVRGMAVWRYALARP
jgi:RimJ/RimL family protein N-acetyltransferase